MNRIALVTGASAGIGEAVAEAFLKEGYEVYNLSRKPCSLEGVINLKTDLSSESSLKKTVGELKALLEKKNLVTLVHNAFAYVSDESSSFEPNEVLRSFQVAILAPMILNEALLPIMGKGSSILFVGSTLSEKAVPKAMSYVTLKHATVGLMRSLTQDLVNFPGVHTACLCPGFTRTQMLEEHLQKTGALESVREKVIQKRLVEPSEIASLIVFTARSPLLNGALIHGNLGQVES